MTEAESQNPMFISAFIDENKVRRSIPPKEELTKRVEKVIAHYREHCPSLVNTAMFRKCHEKQMKHIKKGCLSDHPDFNLYIEIQGKKENNIRNVIYKTKRGSSQIETLHKHSNALIGSISNYEYFTWSKRTEAYLSRYNIDVGIRCGLYKDFGTHNWGRLHRIRKIYEDASLKYDFQDEYLKGFVLIPEPTVDEDFGKLPMWQILGDENINAEVESLIQVQQNPQGLYTPVNGIFKNEGQGGFVTADESRN